MTKFRIKPLVRYNWRTERWETTRWFRAFQGPIQLDIALIERMML